MPKFRIAYILTVGLSLVLGCLVTYIGALVFLPIQKEEVTVDTVFKMSPSIPEARVDSLIAPLPESPASDVRVLNSPDSEKTLP